MICRFWNRAARRGTAHGGAIVIGGLLAASFGGGKSRMGIGTEARAQALQNPPYLFVSAYDGQNSNLDTHNNENSPVTQTATSGP